MLTDSATNEQPLSLERVEAAFRRADIVVDRHGRLLAQRERHGNPAPAVSVIILDASTPLRRS